MSLFQDISKKAVLFSTVLLLIFSNLSFSQTCSHASRDSWTWPGHNNWFIPLWAPSDGKGYIIDQRANTISSVGQANFTPQTLQTTSIRGYQGIAAASDDNGKLLFFTNGRKAWKADGTLISDKILQGNECGSVEDRGSAVHGCMIVRHPLQPNAYYIITIDDIVNQGSPTAGNQKGTCGNGVTFAVVDSSGNMVHDSEPIERDITSGKLGAFRTTEGFSATFHGNGVDIWITFHPLWSDNYVSYLLTCDGFVTPPVSSGDAPWVEIAYANGDVDFSPDGSKMAAGVEIYSTGGKNMTHYAHGTVNVYDFDNWTGQITNRKAVYPKQWSSQNIYNLKFAANGTDLYFSGTSAAGKLDVSVNTQAAIRASATMGNTAFLSNSFHGAALNYQGVIEQRNVTNTRFPQIANSHYGANDMYIPPLEEPDIEEVGPFCDTSQIIDLETSWLCSGLNAEDLVDERHLYSGPGIVDDKKGHFNPAVAGAGTHEIIFTFCGVDDTTYIEVLNCPTCKIDVKDEHPMICVGESIQIDTMINVANGDRTWTIDSFPTTADQSAVITTAGDTVFDATDLGTHYGTYKLKLLNVYQGDSCIDSLYITVNPLPEPNLGNDTSICVNWNPVTFDAGAYAAYDWGTDGGDVQTITVSGAKEYIVEVTDVNGCKEKDTVELIVNQLPNVDLGNDTAICEGDAAITFDANTSAPGMASYTWSDATTNTDLTTDVDGAYWVAIEDNNGCSDTDTVVLTVHLLPNVTLRSDTSICKGDDPIDFIAFNGTPTDSTYTWSSGETDPTISKNVAGIYTVVLEDKFGCLDSDSVELTINDLPIVDLGNDSSICIGAPKVVFDAAKSAPGMTYLWDDGTTTSTFETDVAGEYIVQITDANQCSDTDTVVLVVNAFVDVDMGPDRSICFGDSLVTLNAQIAGAQAYLWQPTLETTKTIVTDVAGEYSVALIDSNGCPGMDTINVIINSLPTVDLGNDTAICNEDPAVVFDAQNAVPDMTYSWSTSETTQTISTDVDGPYWVAIKDVNGCSDTDTVVLKVNDLPIVDLGGPQEICAVDPAITLDAVDATATYLWSTTETTQTIQTKIDGEYSVILTDTNGCIGRDTMYLTVNPMPLVSIADQEICIGDPAVNFDVAATFDTYSWNSGEATQSISTDVDGEYIVTFTDSKGCSGKDTVILTVHPLPTPDLGLDQTICADAAAITLDPGANYPNYAWGGGESSATISTKVAGTYTVEVTDTNGCKESSSVALIVIDLPTPDVILDVTMCPGMSSTLDASVYDNGNGPYTYAWHDGSTGSSFTTNAITSTWVDVIDSYGCVGRDFADVSINGALTVAIVGAPTIELCQGEDTDLIPNYKAADGYFFTWSSGETTESINVDASGTFDLHVDNGLGCEGDATIDVVVHPLPVVAPSVAGICDGEAAIIGNDQGGSYTYSWNTGETTPTISVLTAGIYTQEVTSNKGCISSTTVDVDVYSNPVPDLGNDVTACEAVLVSLNEKSGLNNVTYTWSSGSSNPTIEPTISGTYSLTVTTPEGCVGTDNVDVNFIPIPVVDLGPDITLCDGETAVIDAGNTNLPVLWNTGQNTSQITVGVTNTHIAVANNGTCEGRDTIDIIVVPIPVSNIDQSIASEPYCFDELSISGRGIAVEAGPNANYEYMWGTGETSSEISVQTAGTYIVTITVGNCSIQDQITLRDFCPTTLYVPNTFTPNDDGVNDNFMVSGTYIQDYQIVVYDRWGMLLYESNDITLGWDGTYKGREVQIDTYVYKIYYTVNQEDGAPSKEQKVGHVNVLR